MTLYIYESHTGGMYVSDEDIEPEYLHCEQCGDYDVLLTQVSNLEELSSFLRSQVSLFGSGGYSLDHCEEIFNECAGKLDENEDEE